MRWLYKHYDDERAMASSSFSKVMFYAFLCLQNQIKKWHLVYYSSIPYLPTQYIRRKTFLFLCIWAVKVVVVVVAVVNVTACLVTCFPCSKSLWRKREKTDVNIIIESAKYIEIHFIQMLFAAWQDEKRWNQTFYIEPRQICLSRKIHWMKSRDFPFECRISNRKRSLIERKKEGKGEKGGIDKEWIKSIL